MSKKAEPKSKKNDDAAARTAGQQQAQITAPLPTGCVNICEFVNQKFKTAHTLQPMPESQIDVVTKNTMASNGETLGKVTYKKVDVRIIYVDDYQRHELQNAQIDRLIPIFNINKTGAIMLSYRKRPPDWIFTPIQSGVEFYLCSVTSERSIGQAGAVSPCRGGPCFFPGSAWRVGREKSKKMEVR